MNACIATSLLSLLTLGPGIVSLGNEAPPAEKGETLEQRLVALERQLADTGVTARDASRPIVIRGYLDTSYVANLSDRNETGPVAGFSAANDGRVYDVQYNSFNLDNFDLIIERQPDDEDFSAGFNLDLNIGQNIIALTDSRLFIEQAYVVLNLPVGNGLDLTIGKFYSLLGYESTEPCLNWNFSFSDGARLTPGGQTGALLAYSWNDHITTTLGVVNGWDQLRPNNGGVNFNTSYAFIGRTDFTKLQTSVGEWSPFLAGYTGNDDAGASQLNTHNITVLNPGVLWNNPFRIQPLSLAVEYVRRQEVRTFNDDGPCPLKADAVSLFKQWRWTKWTDTAGRLSWSRYGNSAGNSLDPMDTFSGSNRPNVTEVFSYTLTQSFRVWRDALLRLEWRHDWTPSANVGFGTANAPSHDDLRQEQDTLAVNVVFIF